VVHFEYKDQKLSVYLRI